MAAIGLFFRKPPAAAFTLSRARVSRWKYPGVVGPDLTAQFFTERAEELGVRFLAPIPMRAAGDGR
jgi:hypothetical protein